LWDGLEAAALTDRWLPDGRALELHGLSPQDRGLLLEQRLITPTLNHEEPGTGVIINQGPASIMINEEDHLRLQVLLPGLALEPAWRHLAILDDLVATRVRYAFDARLGFLTACPSNCGTGLRASVLLHVPALDLDDELERVREALLKLGLLVRGFGGEGSSVEGYMMQVATHLTLGQSEAEVLERFRRAIKEVVASELAARQRLLERIPELLYHVVSFGWGGMCRSRAMSQGAALMHYHELRLGIALGMLHCITLEQANALLSQAHPAHLEAHHGTPIDGWAREVYRAQIWRTRLADLQA
jgi:protein arginine kinase